MVLPRPSSWLPAYSATGGDSADCAACDADHATETCRPLQLRRWLRELDGWVVCGQEGVVLQGAWQGLPPCGRRLWNRIFALRLRCWVRKLDVWVVGREESMVLPERRQGMPAGGWRMCLSHVCSQEMKGTCVVLFQLVRSASIELC
jgi:hypothetical protein